MFVPVVFLICALWASPNRTLPPNPSEAIQDLDPAPDEDQDEDGQALFQHAILLDDLDPADDSADPAYDN